jgi:hypothetical protein
MSSSIPNSLLSVICLLSLLSASCRRSRDDRHLYFFEPNEAKRLIASAGGTRIKYTFGEFIRRDSRGKCLRIQINENEMLIAYTDGTTSRVQTPSPKTWLDDSNRLVGWTHWRNAPSDGPADYVSELANGTIIGGDQEWYAFLDITPSGRFLVVDRSLASDSAVCETLLFATTSPLKPLLRWSNFMDVFEKGDRIYVFGRPPLGKGAPIPFEVYMFSNGQFSIVVQTSISLPEPWDKAAYAVDVSSFDEKVLFFDGFRMPKARYCVYDLLNRRVESKGRTQARYAFFLEKHLPIDDIIKARK